jgi:hypothetical protein
MCGQADCLDRELPKNGDVPNSPFNKNGSPMLSAGTTLDWKAMFVRINGTGDVSRFFDL